MPLIECPECRKGVSDKAAACPHCGHPIAGYGNFDPTAADRAQRLLRDQATDGGRLAKNGKGGRGVLVLMLVGIVVLIAVGKNQDAPDKAKDAPDKAKAIGSNQEAGDKTKPTCKSDWRLCADNADLINNFGDITRGQVSCKYEANKLAKYGSPTWPWFPFGTFYKGNEYVKTGIATLVEKDAQFSNAFGAMVHSTVTCRYDLNLQKVLDATVAPN